MMLIKSLLLPLVAAICAQAAKVGRLCSLALSMVEDSCSAERVTRPLDTAQ
jgi:hypothetical protein